MKVVVSRSGGIAGLRVTWDVQVDEQPDAAAWMRFLEELPWDEAVDSAPMPDRYVYRIRCAPHEVVLAEPQVHGAWKDLIDRVRAASER
ncbi:MULTISPECIES: protealysin inhibitor emfourin [unclassified Cryobacterium]|uniref:protealysin inhibitor emfourin n=1 Tax=unclassified Cryobacterium TaxID=2649013 RepID=UPI001069A5C4|nr:MULTISPECIES: protealysin inhibitor emfourin [unclassified Cryobacterium]TFC54991.1 hypothetical protein E3O68_08410 [Cryobacterium sp. TMB3-1-2]TFC62590.1 hypothetical protein E3O60_01680 [Cryobacterium sp. TMB1-7]TFC70329.1 hypothetical protein E3T21_10365 [Cryobacterium sp. TMB3-15]TFC75670.1 hypothetical protein E3T22_11645 [Cryobacterium sp. TMB3-10]TFD45440.1 hypothetical protein E3T58_02255 [Cryobacterium sp. TMB3-12]